MFDNVKIGLSKITVLLIYLSLIMSGVTVFNLGFNVRVLHLLLPILFFNLLLNKFKWIKGAYKILAGSSTFYYFIGLLLITCYSTMTSDYFTSESIKLLIAFLFNCGIGLVFLGIMSSESLDIKFYNQLSFYSVMLIGLVIIIQFLLSIIGFYEPHMYGKNGFFLLGRPAAFFGDPGWLSYWLIIFGAVVFAQYKAKLVSFENLVVFVLILGIGLILNQSRITIFLVTINFFLIVLRGNLKQKFYFFWGAAILFASLIGLLVLGVIEVPKNLYYDIINVKANPRLYDMSNILHEFKESGNYWFGNGLGSISRLKEIYPWRNYTNSHNVILLQLLNDVGIFGILMVLVIVRKLYQSLETYLSKVLFVELMVILMFHNIFPYFQLFWFLLVVIFVIDRKLLNNSYEK